MRHCDAFRNAQPQPGPFGFARLRAEIRFDRRTFLTALQRTYGAGVNYSIGAGKVGFVWTRTPSRWSFVTHHS